ncbi:MAG: MarR family winged helix-turn-helix transcriptional regulator [Inquilinaceae bacterium]
MAKSKSKKAGEKPDNLGRLLRQTSQTWANAVAEDVARRGHDGFSLPRADMLARLKSSSGVRVTDIAAGTGFTKQAVGQIVGDLEKLGYVRRETDPGDARARRLICTDAGNAFLESVDKATKTANRLLASPLDKTERKRLLKLLKKLPSPADA